MIGVDVIGMSPAIENAPAKRASDNTGPHRTGHHCNDHQRPRESGVRLPDGRQLGYAEYGDPQGSPVFYFHGFPGSRFEAAPAHEAAIAVNAHIFAFDRPGYGLSDPQPGRMLIDWARDVGHAADALGISRFAVLGVSGGGPYALACAYAIPQRLSAIGVVCGLGPTDDVALRSQMSWPLRAGLFLGRHAPWFYSFLHVVLFSVLRCRPEQVLRVLSIDDPEPDRAVMRRSDLREAILTSIREALRCGARGLTQDVRLYARSWGFALESISAPVSLWHGEADTTVPSVMGHQVAARLPYCRPHFLRGEGHFSLPFNHSSDILRALINLE